VAIQRRKITYVLGAGFSYGSGHRAQRGKSVLTMPLQSNFFETLFRFHFKSIKDLDVVARLTRKYFSPNSYRSRRGSGANRHSDIKALSIEDVVTFFEEMARDLPEEEGRVFRDAEAELRRWTIELIDYLSKSSNAYRNRVLRVFGKEKLLDTDTAITFNWDTLLDQVLHKRKHWHPAWGYGRTVGKVLRYPARKQPKARKKHATLLKLHGSINWVARGDDASISRSFSSGGRVDDVIMMPPKMLKSEVWGEEPTDTQTDPLAGNWAVHDRHLYPGIWREAEDHLSRSKRIVFVGYSFPAADVSVFGLIRRALANAKAAYGEHPDIHVVDPNAASISERFGQLFQINVPVANQFLSLSSYVLPQSR
jgi:hypothetical protein